MEKIELETKSDRELLILAVTLLNGQEDRICKLEKWRDGNGVPGAKFQLWVLWGLFLFAIAKLW